LLAAVSGGGTSRALYAETAASSAPETDVVRVAVQAIGRSRLASGDRALAMDDVVHGLKKKRRARLWLRLAALESTAPSYSSLGR
jgi:hypothetical protein